MGSVPACSGKAVEITYFIFDVSGTSTTTCPRGHQIFRPLYFPQNRQVPEPHRQVIYQPNLS